MIQGSRAVILAGATLLTLAQPTHAPVAAQSQGVATPPAVAATAAAPIAAPTAPNGVPDAAASAAPAPDFATFVEGLRSDALARGISAATVNEALNGLEPSQSVIQSDQNQAETVLSIDQYVSQRLTQSFVKSARQHAAKHKPLLRRVSDRYGVPSDVLIAIWGIESNFGRFRGTRPTIQALATLAWEGRRGPFFRAELMDALSIVDRGYISLEKLRGSWAGAMGQPQFMPSSYLKWAQDFDNDGDRDIWQSEQDVFASIANYLKEHGWTSNLTWGREVKLPPGGLDDLRAMAGMRAEGCRAERQMTNRLPLARWQELGVRTSTGASLPQADVNASLIHTGRRAFLVYGNYEAILGYNCAHSYALAVALMSDRVGS